MKNIFNKIMVTLVGLLSFTALFIPQLALADSFSDTYLMLAPSMSGDYNYSNGYNDGYRQASGVKYACKFVDENGKTVKSDIFYDNMTLGYVTKLLDDENDNVKNLKNGEFKPSTKSLSCQKNSNLDGYAITPIEFSCRTLNDKNKVLDDKNYNIVQVLNNIERVDAENAASASKKLAGDCQDFKEVYNLINYSDYEVTQILRLLKKIMRNCIKDITYFS